MHYLESYVWPDPHFQEKEIKFGFNIINFLSRCWKRILNHIHMMVKASGTNILASAKNKKEIFGPFQPIDIGIQLPVFPLANMQSENLSIEKSERESPWLMPNINIIFDSKCLSVLPNPSDFNLFMLQTG